MVSIDSEHHRGFMVKQMQTGSHSVWAYGIRVLRQKLISEMNGDKRITLSLGPRTIGPMDYNFSCARQMSALNVF